MSEKRTAIVLDKHVLQLLFIRSLNSDQLYVRVLGPGNKLIPYYEIKAVILVKRSSNFMRTPTQIITKSSTEGC